MKFKDMPYERVNFDEVEKELKGLMEEFDAAKSGEEQFAVHQKFYELNDKALTLTPRILSMKKRRNITMRSCLCTATWYWLTKKSFMIPLTESIW